MDNNLKPIRSMELKILLMATTLSIPSALFILFLLSIITLPPGAIMLGLISLLAEPWLVYLLIKFRRRSSLPKARE